MALPSLPPGSHPCPRTVPRRDPSQEPWETARSHAPPHPETYFARGAKQVPPTAQCACAMAEGGVTQVQWGGAT